MKKNLALLFALLLAGQTLLSCGDASKDQTASTDTAASTEALTEAVTEEPREYANLPEKDFGGADAKIFIAYNIEGGTVNFGVSKNEFGAHEENGDVVNDARYQRNTTVEEGEKTYMSTATVIIAVLGSILVAGGIGLIFTKRIE